MLINDFDDASFPSANTNARFGFMYLKSTDLSAITLPCECTVWSVGLLTRCITVAPGLVNVHMVVSLISSSEIRIQKT